MLRHVIAHLRRQDWTAIVIQFVLLVTGVFLGIQVSNWNQDRGDRAHERELLVDLRAEVAESIRQTQIRTRAFAQVERSGQRAIAFLDAGKDCGNACWPVLVDFFHTSQWQRVTVHLPTYDEMRRNGWPRQRALVDALEDYLRQSAQVFAPLERPPAYRALVRGLIPLAAHAPYWKNCFTLANGEEAYVDPCPAGVSPEVAAAGIASIRANPDIHRTLTEWAGFMGGYVASLDSQNDAARHALALIDAELKSDRAGSEPEPVQSPSQGRQ
ncbi:MAG: hypothetical protein JSS28_04670 [Proteobacteria bacterium]|nr:hypothetical protein [Pseudomonadota bacterium]